MSDLPDGWEWAKIADLASSIGNGRSVPDGPDDGYPVLRLTAIRSGKIDIAACKKGAWTAEEANSFRIRKDDILIARGNGSKRLVGRGGIVQEDSEVAFPDTMIRICFDETKIHPKYAVLIWDSPQVRTQIESCARTTAGIYKISQRDLREIKISLPPLDEQTRVVAAIEEQFSRLDAGVVALKKARQNLRRLRDLLPIRLLDRFGGSASASPHLMMSLADISEKVVDCPHSTPKFLPDGMPVIDTTCISPGVIHRDRLRYVDPESYADRIRRLPPQEGDLIFAREGTVGTTVMVPPDLHPCLGQRVMLFRPNTAKARSDYLCLVMNSELVKRQYRSKLLGSTVPHLNVRDAKELEVPVPTLQVQTAIAMEADRITSILNAAEKSIEANLQHSSSLRSSILDAAFSGNLS